MLSKEFIEKVFLRDLRKVVGFLNYLPFASVVLGIEFLGACLDEYNWDEQGQSEKRIKLAITHLMPQYKFCWERIKGLRNGFAHHFSPGSGVILTHRAELRGKRVSHLQSCEGKIVLVIEDFYNDFAKACEEVINRIEKEEITNPKVYKNILKTEFSISC